MVEQLKQMQEAIRATDAKIKQRCIRFPEYTHLLTISVFEPDVSDKLTMSASKAFSQAAYHCLDNNEEKGAI